MNKIIFSVLVFVFFFAIVFANANDANGGNVGTQINIWANGGGNNQNQNQNDKECDKLPGQTINKKPLIVLDSSPVSASLNTLLAHELDLTPTLLPFPSFQGVVNLIKSCSVDYAVVGLSITDARRNDGVLYSVPYARERLFLVKLKTSTLSGNSINLITLGQSTLDILADGVVSNPQGVLAGKTIVKDAIIGQTTDVIAKLRTSGDDTVAVFSNAEPLPDDVEEIMAGDFTQFGTDIAIGFCAQNTALKQKVDEYLNNKFNAATFRGMSLADMIRSSGFDF